MMKQNATVTIAGIRQLIIDKNNKDHLVDNAILDFLSIRKNLTDEYVEKIILWLRDYRDHLYMRWVERTEIVCA